MTTPQQRVAELLAAVERPRGCAAELLCDGLPCSADLHRVVRSRRLRVMSVWFGPPTKPKRD